MSSTAVKSGIVFWGEIKDRFLTITRGQKIVYVVDARYDDDNEAKIVALAQEADVFLCSIVNRPTWT